MENTAQQVDSCIVAWMDCVNFTLYEMYCTAVGQCYCSLDGVYYTEYNMDFTAQQVDSGIVA